MLAILTYIHIGFGLLSALAGSIAILVPKGRLWHARAGTVFFVCMVGIFVTAMGITLFEFNFFLVLVAIFSIYLALSGYLLAKNRNPAPTKWQWWLTRIAILTGVLMLLAGTYLLQAGEPRGTVLLAFSAITLFLSLQEWDLWRRNKMHGPQRIAAHLSRMLGGSIAIWTAATIVNTTIEPLWLRWLLPTFVFVPMIVAWNIRTLRR